MCLTSHVDLGSRISERSRAEIHGDLDEVVDTAWRRSAQAVEAFNGANEAEAFQTVGVRCREALIRRAGEIAERLEAAAPAVQPKASDFRGWAGIAADTIASCRLELATQLGRRVPALLSVFIRLCACLAGRRVASRSGESGHSMTVRFRVRAAAAVVAVLIGSGFATAPGASATADLSVASAQAAASRCGAPNNPWGYNYCGGKYVSKPAGSICDYFSCMDNFWNGRGYVAQCRDGVLSKSGGISGACSWHGGVRRPLYKR